MQQLETLCIQLGITEHIPALSELRDDLLRATAAQLQESANALAAKNAELETTQHALGVATLRLEQMLAPKPRPQPKKAKEATPPTETIAAFEGGESVS